MITGALNHRYLHLDFASIKRLFDRKDASGLLDIHKASRILVKPMIAPSKSRFLAQIARFRCTMLEEYIVQAVTDLQHAHVGICDSYITH